MYNTYQTRSDFSSFFFLRENNYETNVRCIRLALRVGAHRLRNWIILPMRIGCYSVNVDLYYGPR